MKVLGIKFDNGLNWDPHIAEITARSKRMISGLRIIRHHLTQDQFMSVATSQYYGALFYAMPVWYEPSKIKHKTKLDTLHYKLLRLAVKDWGRLYPKDMLDTLGRAQPGQFANYATASIVINTHNSGLPK